MRILVTGADGQLGYDVVMLLQESNIEVFPLTRQEADITQYDSLKLIVFKYKPDVIIHCAAYTNVESAELNPEECRDVNVTATKYLATLSKSLDSKFVYISTDYVFSGAKETPYETSDEANPMSVYGETKLDGELEVKKLLNKYFIIRTSWSFGNHGKNFVKKMLELAHSRREISVVDDQVGSPTYTQDLAKTIAWLVQTEKYGTYHMTNEGYCSWAEFAEEIFKIENLQVKVKKVTTTDYPSIVKRPKNSRLSKKSLDEAEIARLPAWKDALQRYLIAHRNH